LGAVAHSSEVMATTVPADLQVAMAAFQRPRTAADAVSAADFDVALAQQQGVKPSLSRLVVNTASMKMWLMPESSRSCLLDDDGLGGCVPNSAIENRGLVGGIVGTSQQMWFGVVPTKVRNLRMEAASGSASPIAVNGDGGFQVPNNNESLLFTAADGTPVSFSPAGSPSSSSSGGPQPARRTHPGASNPA
jgi:hypothetical protein